MKDGISDTDLVQRHTHLGVAVLTLSAPKSINALSEAMLTVLSTALDEIADDPAVKTGKRAFYELAEMPLEKAYAHAGRVMAENMITRDAKAGIGAFTRKEPMPDWTGE